VTGITGQQRDRPQVAPRRLGTENNSRLTYQVRSKDTRRGKRISRLDRPDPCSRTDVKHTLSSQIAPRPADRFEHLGLKTQQLAAQQHPVPVMQQVHARLFGFVVGHEPFAFAEGVVASPVFVVVVADRGCEGGGVGVCVGVGGKALVDGGLGGGLVGEVVLASFSIAWCVAVEGESDARQPPSAHNSL
jgi:hypothetical protein